MKLSYKLILCFALVSGTSFTQLGSNYELPVATFIPLGEYDICPTGKIRFSWDFCSVDADSNTVADWTFIDATFSMGDGGTVFYDDQTFAPFTYTFTSFGSTQVVGNARFKDENGLISTVTIKNITDISHNGDPCYLYQNPLEPATNFLPIDVPKLSIGLNFDTNNNYLRFYTNYQLYPISQNPSDFDYYLKLDGSNIDLGYNQLPTQTTFFHSEAIPVPGQYLATLIFKASVGNENTGSLSCEQKTSTIVDIEETDTCTTCNTFKPEIGEKYWVSAWVKEDISAPVTKYTNAELSIDFIGSSSSAVQFNTTGEIIDGWQRIVGSFIVPFNTTELNINLDNNGGSHQVFFDDVRIHPFNSSMKSYVYDPETLWLVAELDDNNYATFYEYDNEGKLIRIKKETSRGIMTIQESRSRTIKK